MALWSSELAQIVWAESKALGFGRADGSGDVNVIRRMVAQLAASTNGDGFDKREPLPATNDKVYGDTVTGLLSICEGAQNASAPQSRLILWEAGDRTDRPNPATEPAPPPPWNTMQAGITYQGRFQPGGRLIDIFARGPVEGDTDRPVMVNALTGTGLPDGKSIRAAQPATQAEAKPGLTKMAWAIGIAASLFFLFGGMLAIWSGRADGSPLALLRSLDVQYRVIDKLADTCIDYQKVFPSAKPGICNVLFAPSTTYAKPAAQAQQPAAAPASTAASTPAPPIPFGNTGETIIVVKKCIDGNAALAPTNVPKPTDAAAADAAFSCDLAVRSMAAAGIINGVTGLTFPEKLLNQLMGLRTIPETKSILLQLLAMTFGIAGLAIALGIGTKGRVDGIWIDERNRVSLARAQVTLWTIVALGGFATMALFNVGLSAPVSFPQIPASIAAALGIAFTSPMISALILKSSAFGAADSPSSLVTTVGGSPRGSNDFANRGALLSAANSALEARADPSLASIADVFFGEQVSNSGSVDISRLQNVVLTVTLVLGYFAMQAEQLRSIAPETLLTGLASLPDPGGAFTSILLVSHATYLGTKAYNAGGKSGNGK
jgi:hypothetical protein